MLTSEDIARHTQEYLERGGVINVIPFLVTRFSNWSVALYRRVHRYGYRVRDTKSLTVGNGSTALPPELIDSFNNPSGSGSHD